MPQLVEVRFKGNRKAYFEWSEPEPLRQREAVVVESERGLDYGIVSATGSVAEQKCSRCQSCKVGGGAESSAGTPARRHAGDESQRHDPEPTRKVVRRATGSDTRSHTELRRQEDDVRRKVREKVQQHGLQMKVSDTEWQWDRNKLTVFFTAERRVDFRTLVRDLAATFRTRIELRQIGVRDEAARLGGIGRCGRELCSATWLPSLEPIGLHIARDQRLSLNPAQISGPCGRLLCCLRFEHQYYVDSRRRFPKEGRVIQTSKGAEKVWSVDIFRDQVTLRTDDGSQRIVALEDLRNEMRLTEDRVPMTDKPGTDDGAPTTEKTTAQSVIGPRSPVVEPEGPQRKRRRRRRRRKGGAEGPGAPPE